MRPNPVTVLAGLAGRRAVWLAALGVPVILSLAAAAPLPATPPEAVGPALRPLVEADWVRREGGFSLSQSRQVLDRGGKLLERLQAHAAAPRLESLAGRLRGLAARHTALAARGNATAEEQRRIFLESCGVVREIAFANPLLREVDQLLFITRHDAKGVFHMVDQFYGFNARPGGRLLVLTNPFGPEPKLRDLAANATVAQGRLAGRKLEGGAFLSPEVSFDGQTVLFAWTEARGQDLEWSQTASYHLFKISADGAGLTQLTDGSGNDFDPCYLPNGRIVFISERRGGYLRCGRHCPTYTMFGMAADGSDLICLSFHETHEWQPSITHDGRIVYTRWDYVDRDTNMAHHPWTCRPDGSDPRSFHGNYPARRETRPWMEMDLRAIPGSGRFVATAAAHHGNAFGSLVLVDPQIADDGASSQLTRLTPETPFPEAETKMDKIAAAMVYGTPWPLSEDDYLCVYDPAAKNRGVYWIDRFGNKELIYRDPAISCLSPMPLQARTTPPVIAENTLQTADARRAAGERPATMAVMNVYDSDFAWPKDSKVTALRVIQVLPKSTPPPNVPRIGVAEQSNARAVLGTVPVEADGSAYFLVPDRKAVYFQALDERGLAIQSMRSVTYAHPGEQLTCQGCHEPRQRAAAPSKTVPLALRRAPSPITPEADGSHPFNYVRLVQPVLDRHCVACHKEKQALDLAGAVEGKNGWTRSYANLAGKYGFYYDVANGSINRGQHGGSRTPAGQFGARASRLLPYLDERHYRVHLPVDDWRRVTLWLDCNSEFYGAYEEITAQAQGLAVRPILE